MRSDTITLGIFESYTHEEKDGIAAKMAQAQADLEAAETEKKASDAVYNGRIKKLAEDVSTLAKQYNKGGETAQIGCDIRYDNPEQGKKSYYRMDTGLLVETHDMSWEEKQETIQFPLAESPKAPTDAEVEGALNSVSKPEEETTRLCDFPGCILFSKHDGNHEFRSEDDAPDQLSA